jgi:hypothetical protein
VNREFEKRKRLARLGQDYEREADAILSSAQWRAMRATLLPKGHRKECWLCECSAFGSPGIPAAPADSLDHLVPRSENPGMAFLYSNVKPAHRLKCPACGIACQSVRGNLSAKAGYAKVQRRKQKALGLETRKIEIDGRSCW